MKFALIESGRVTNIIEADAQYAAAVGAIDATGAAIGDTWDGVVFTSPPVAPPTRDQLKAARTAAVVAITVTTAAGNTFDGDETSQTRMARAIIALSTGLAPSVGWVLADNSVIQATAAELTEALVLAGQAQAAIWVIE